MKKNIIFYVIFISLFLTNIAKAEIEKGKWKSSGITKGFIVTSINKRSISDVESLSTLISQLPKDDGVLVEGIYPNGVKAYYGIGW